LEQIVPMVGHPLCPRRRAQPDERNLRPSGVGQPGLQAFELNVVFINNDHIDARNFAPSERLQRANLQRCLQILARVRSLNDAKISEAFALESRDRLGDQGEPRYDKDDTAPMCKNTASTTAVSMTVLPAPVGSCSTGRMWPLAND
jgi:hypothetical protein